MTYRSGGSHSINATFNGGLDFEPSNSNVLSQSVTEVLPSPPATGRQCRSARGHVRQFAPKAPLRW